tara:strand:- start:85 stop:318 length:234 start_codon:yes stop_codon:yes gene_type:complete
VGSGTSLQLPRLFSVNSLINTNICKQIGANKMSDIMKKIFAIAMISGMGLGLAACETADGFGQDVEDAGEAIQEEAE